MPNKNIVVPNKNIIQKLDARNKISVTASSSTTFSRLMISTCTSFSIFLRSEMARSKG
jgi:hypothetical protein